MKKYTYIVFLLSISLLAGCWSKRELNELAIATSLGIDKTEEGYTITVQILNPNELAGKGSTGRTEVVKFTQTGDTVFEALRKISKDTPRKIYMAHIRIVVFGEEMAREGIGEVLDIISRDHEMRSDFYISVAKGLTASEILNIQTASEKIPANKIASSLENSEKNWAPTKAVKIDELVSSIISKGKEPVLTGIYAYGDLEYGSSFENIQNTSPATGIRINSLGVFFKDKLLGWLTENESKGYNYITDNISETIIDVPCKEGKASIEVTRSQTKIKGEMKNGIPRINLQITTHGNIGEIACNSDLTQQEVIKKLEKRYEEQTENSVKSSIKKAQDKFKSDIFGFGEVIYRSYPKEWKRLEPNWPQEFANLKVNVNVKARLHRLGTTSKSIQNEIKE